LLGAQGGSCLKKTEERCGNLFTGELRGIGKMTVLDTVFLGGAVGREGGQPKQ